MQYMLMCCFSEKAWADLPDDQRGTIMQAYGALMQSLAQQGQLRGGGQLYPTSSATTVRMKNGAPVITDGPFAETKEQLGGYHVVECLNLDEALAVAARIPTLPVGGTIEVRPFASSQEGDATSRWGARVRRRLDLARPYAHRFLGLSSIHRKHT